MTQLAFTNAKIKINISSKMTEIISSISLLASDISQCKPCICCRQTPNPSNLSINHWYQRKASFIPSAKESLRQRGRTKVPQFFSLSHFLLRVVLLALVKPKQTKAESLKAPHWDDQRFHKGFQFRIRSSLNTRLQRETLKKVWFAKV